MYALSIRVLEALDQSSHNVKHYQIKETPNGTYSIENRNFLSLQEIVKFYSTQAGGLYQMLGQSCPKPKLEILPKSRSDEIDRIDLQIAKSLGSGDFGTVFYGTFLGKAVVIKSLKTGSMDPQAFLKEAEIMRLCNHDNIVKLYGVCSEREPLIFVTEFVEKGTLLYYLRDNPFLPLPNLMDICAQVASGMSYLESIRIVHRNFAARNILVGNNNEIKVKNFGLAIIIEEGAQEYTLLHSFKFPVKWTAPEAALFGKFSSKSDVWSFGVLMYEVITYGKAPYRGQYCF